MTAFNKNDQVISLVNAQGLKKGTQYTVVQVTVESLGFFGEVVTYKLQDPTTGFMYDVVNGHLILQSAGEEEKPAAIVPGQDVVATFSKKGLVAGKIYQVKQLLTYSIGEHRACVVIDVHGEEVVTNTGLLKPYEPLAGEDEEDPMELGTY